VTVIVLALMPLVVHTFKIRGAFKWYFINKTLKIVVFLLCITSQNTIYFNGVFFKKNLCFIFQFQFYPSTFNFLGLGFHDLFRFLFYGIILTSWSESQVNLFFSFLIDFFFKFELYFNILLIMNYTSWFVLVFFIRLSLSHDMSHRFDG